MKLRVGYIAGLVLLLGVSADPSQSVFGSCGQCNPEDCTCSGCPTGKRCSNSTKLCETICSNKNECETNQVCDNGGCKFCSDAMDKDNACVKDYGDVGRKYCDTGKAAGKGRCVACLNAGQCTAAATPFCDSSDADNNICRGCRKDSECTSGLCAWPPDRITGVTAETCIDRSMFVLVKKAGCGAGGPLCEIADAVAANKSIILVSPTNGQTEYTSFTVSTGSRQIIKTDDSGAAVVKGLVTVEGDATLNLVGITINSGSLICKSVNASVNFRNGVIEEGPGDGVNAGPCKEVKLDRSHIRTNKGNGISVGTAVRYRVTNSLITENTSSAQPASAAINFDNLNAGGEFYFNTVANNRNAGIYCQTGQKISNSIFVFNGKVGTGTGVADQISKCTLDSVVVGSMGNEPGVLKGTPVFESNNPADATGYRLQRTSECCIDKVAADPMIKTDFFGNPRPKGAMADVGFHEVQ